MDFMKKLNPFKRIRRQSEQPQQPQSARHHLRHGADSKRKAADKELQHLNQKIEKILANLDENEAGMEFSREEECVVCLSSKATMKTYPCGHCVVCRLCFVKTIQSAVSERRLPLKCVVCRTKILKLKQQRSRPNNNPPSTGHPPGGANTRAGQPPVNNFRSNPSSTCSASHLKTTTTKQKPPPPIRPSAAGTGGHRPTATKLMQPLLIYPAAPGAAAASSSVRPGDLKRRPGPGWMSPTDASDPVTTSGGTTTAFRHRPKTLLGSASSTGAPGTGGGGSGGDGGGV